MTCRQCRGPLTPGQIRHGLTRCKKCRAKFPGRVAPKQKPTPSQRAFAIQPPKVAPQPDRGSWWLDKDRAAFAEVVRTRTFPYSRYLALTPWTVE